MDPITAQNQQKEEKTVPATKVQKSTMNLEGFARKDNENILDYITRVGQENTEIYNQNVDRYTIRLRPEEYAEINDLINVDEDKEAQSYKIASAMKYSKMYGIPLDEAYNNLDNFNYALYGKDLEKKSQKDIYHTVVDMLTLGQNTVDIGMIGGQLREANDRGDTEAVARLTELYRKYQEQNEFLQKNLPQNLGMKIVEAGAQSLPFTMGAIGMSIISPVTGFTYSAGVMAGQEYLDLLDMGASHETAKAASTVAGVLEGIVENELGNVAGALGARAAGTKATELLRRNVIDKVTKNVAEKMHYSGGWRIVANVLMRAGAENLEEGAEEAVQETISLVSKHIVKELDGLDIPGMTPQEIAADLTENFVGGLYGSILLGSGTFISNSIAAKADYDAVKKAAGIIPSEEAFTKAVSENPAFSEMTEETKAKAIHEVYQNFGRQRDEALKTSAEDIAESISADEENEVFDVQYDEDGNEIEVEEVSREVRDDNGKLYSQYDTVEETEDGSFSGKKVYGDATKENNNRYGYISYTVDEEAGTVTIDEFKTSKARQNLRNEMYNDFAADFANYDIVWNPKGNSAIQSKAEIERINPEGGLNYYKNGKQADAETRVKIAQELRANLNKKTVTNEMIAPLVAEFEALGNTFGLNVTDFYNNQFNGQIFGDVQEAKDAALSQGKGPIRGGIALNKADTIKGLRAVIYAAENADFSTFSHELAHMGRRMAELEGGKLAEEMNRAFNIGEDGWTVAKEEEFAEGFENYLHTGEAKTPGLKELFQKLAEFLARTFHQLNDKIKLSDDVKKVYDQLLSGDESVLKMAEDAVSNITAEPTNNVAENVVSQETTENITKSGENLTENDEVLSDEEIKTLVSDFTNEELKTLTDAGLITEETAQAVQETKLDDVTQAAVASILDDPEIPQDKKVEAVLKANGESFQIKQENIERYQARTDLTEEEKKAAIDDILNNRTTGGDGSGMPYSMLDAGKDMLFQIIGKKGAQALDEANEETIRMDNQRIAEEMEAAGKDAKTIRLATGWEKGADGQWKYEIDDNEYEIQDNSFYPGYNVPTLTEEQSEKLESLRTKLKNNNWNYDVFNEEEKKIFDKLTDEENFFANSIIEYDNGNFKWKKFVELQNVLKADELYKAYPMLKYVKFKVEKLGSGKAATFYPSINAIKIDKDYGSKVALIHEIQHAIQRIEGFANGSSIETLTQNYRSKIFDRMNEAYKAYHSDEKLKLDFDEYRRIFNKVAAASNDDFMTFYDELFKFEDSHENVKSFLKGLEQARKDLNLQFDYEAAPLFNGKITDTYYDRSYQEIEDKLVKDYYNFQALDDYKKIAGEVESRNVEARYGMTMEERRAQLLEETEDVPRNAQIVLFQEAELDKEYEEAVNSGNTGKAIQMLKQKAEANGYSSESDYQGTSAFNGAAPSANGYFSTKEERLNAIADESFEDTETFGDYAYDNADALGFQYLIEDPRSYRFANEKRKEAISNLRSVLEKARNGEKNLTIKMFRSVPADIKETSFRPGDWITPSRLYAIDNAEVHSWDNYNIIEQEVPLEEIWWDGNDIAEWGYDDESENNTFKNVPNNRKKLEITYDENGKLIPLSERFNEKNPSILFQTAYHGSGADFDKFDTDTYGLSGEGSMSFGYGTYVSGSEAIARDYALRQRPEGELDVNYKGREANYTERNAYIRLDQNNFNVEEAIKAIEDDIDWAKAKLSVTNNKEWWTDYIKEDERQIALLKDPDFNIKDFTASDTKSKLYTVEIPDDGYLQWDKNVSPEIVEEILKKSPYLYTLRNLLNNYEQYKDNPYATYLYGSNVYKALSKELRGGDKAASHFLYNMGFKGIEYPAGTIHGNGEGARNFVIFNDDDARITNKILFQNLIDEGVLNEAAGFESWVEFKEFCETMGLDGVPEEASSDWYLNTWEVAHNVSPTTAEREAQLAAEREEQREEARRDPVMVDAEWLTYIQKEGNLETFLKLTNQATGITEEELKSYDAEERAFFLNEQDKINSVLSHPTINSARKRLLNHDELTPAHRERVLKLFKNRARDYRAIFADVTGQEKWSVEQSESLDAELANRARRFNLIKYDSEVENMTPEQKRRLENLITDKEVLKKFREDKVKMDDPDVEHYVEMLESQVKKIEKELGEARREFQNDMEMLGNLQARDIIRQYEEFLNLKGEAEFKKVALPAGSKNAERIGEKAKRERQAGIRENYNSLAAKWETFKEEVEAKVKLQERLRAEGKISELEEKIRAEYDAKRMKTMLTKTESLNAMKNEYAQKKAEQAAARQLKEMRKTLVKRVMRRVNFNSIDYNQAKQIIAIQKVFEPNLRGGINKWIGTENKLAREIWSSWHTDFEAQKNMLRRLEAKGKHELVTLLENTKTEEDFEKWTKKERSALERAMPRQDWIKELNLDAWKDERDNAIQLDIKEIETTRQVTQPDGTKKTVPYTRIEMGRDVQDMLLNALGPDMAYAIENRHFEDWTTGEMEELAKKINKLFKDGRDLLQAKKETEIREADRIRNLIRDAIRTTGIQINDDDPEDVKKKKQAKIDKILGVHHELPGTAASANEKQQSWIDRILHGYHDANVRRVARILDNYAEGTATELLYFRENDCFNRKARAIDRRNAKIDAVVDANKLDMRKLGNTVKFYGFTFTVDELLMLKAAQLNQKDYYQEQLKDNPELKYEHALKESAYQAVMYGNLITPEEREEFRRIDEEIEQKELERKEKLDAATLAGDKDLIALYSQIPADMVDISGNIEKKGTSKLKALAESRMNGLLSQFNDTINEFMPLIEAIRADYAAEFDNINRVSIEEFNAPVWREKWYLPLVRLTAAGETHEQRLKQDLLGHSAGTGKAGTEKGFTKKRNEIGPMNQNPVELGLYKTWADSVERNEHFVAYAGYVRELNRVFFSKDAVGTMQELENRYGKAMKDYIDVYVKEVAAPQRVEPRKELDKVFHILRGNTAPAYLGWKFSSILKQGIESPAPFMQFINPVEYTRAALQIASNKEVRESIEVKSAFMKARVFDPLVDLINENVEKSLNKPSYGLKKFQQKGMEGLEWIDWACVAPGWLAIYDKEYRRLQETEQARYEARLSELEEQNASRFGQFHLTEEQLQQQAHDDVTQDIEAAAVLKADDCVRLCQPSNRNVDLAPMFKNNREAAKAVLQFQTALNVIWQNLRYDIPYAVRNKEYKQIIGMILGYVMAGIMSGVVCQGILKDDDEPEDTAKKLGYYATTQFLDSVPIVGGNLERLAERAITGEGGPMFGSSLWPTFDKYYNAASAFIKEDYEKALNNVTQGLALTLGLPLSGAKEAGRALGIGDGDGELELNPLALTGQRD